MARFMVERFLQAIPLIFGVTIITFVILQMAPGDPLDVMRDPLRTSTATLAKAEKELGFDQPIHIQYLRWLKQLMQGNFGYSYLSGKPVTELLSTRLPSTMVLACTALIISYAVGIPIGVISAIKRYSLMDRILTILSFGGISVPNFFLCLAFVYIFSLKLRFFPTSGFGTLGVTLTGIDLWQDRLKYLVLPAVSLSIPAMAGIVRYTRSSMLDVLSEDYVRTARSKGLRESVVIMKHALTNSLLPVITLFGLQFPMLFGGAFVVEYIFDWPGMGTLAVESVTYREYAIVMAINLISAWLVLGGSLVADLLYVMFDPRIRLD
jgi:peptide/nickel transport system permease protein